jgi:hypothetical protein
MEIDGPTDDLPAEREPRSALREAPIGVEGLGAGALDSDSDAEAALPHKG